METMSSQKKRKLNVWDIRERANVEERHTIFVLVRILVSIVLLGAISSGLDMIGVKLLGLEAGKALSLLGGVSTFETGAPDALYTQISVSFIVISLTTILSSNAKPIYWTDKVELSLVKPILTSFSAYASYIFACLIWSIGCFISNSEKIYIGFWMSIIVTAFLTFKLISVYFGNNKVKLQAEQYFEWMKGKDNKEEYDETKQKMVTVMSKNIIENNFVDFEENFDFLYKEMEFELLWEIMEISYSYNKFLFEQTKNKVCDRKTYPELMKYNSENVRDIKEKIIT